MSREEEIKKELAQIEEDKKKEQIQKQLESMTLVGKFYATHYLNRYMTKKSSYRFDVIKITGKEYRKESAHYKPYGYTGERIGVFKDGDRFTVEKVKFFDDDPHLWRYEITEKEYNQVANNFVPKIEKFIDELRDDFVATDWCSQGDWGDEKNAGQLLSDVGIDFIELSFNEYKAKGSNARILEILRWNHHPYLFNTKLYKGQGWMEIVKNIRDKMYKNALSWGSSIYQRDMPRVETLDNFIKEYENVV